MRLSRADLEQVLAFVGVAGDAESDEPFEPWLLDELRRLVRCDDVAYCEIDRARRKVTLMHDTAEDGVSAPEDVYWATLHEHPIRNHRRKTGDLRALKLLDFATKRTFRRTAIYNEFFRPWGTDFVMSVGLRAPPGQTRTFVVYRDRRDFDERDRAVLDLLQPHLVQIRRAADERRRARRVLVNGAALLTPRELEVLSHVAEGMTNRAIAAALWVAPGTVRRHLDNIYEKLGVHTRAAAVHAVRSAQGDGISESHSAR